MKLKYLIIAAAACVLASCSSKQQEPTSGIELSWMDQSVKPGDDFFEFACGGWVKNNPMPEEFSRYGVTEVLAEMNRKQIREIIEEMGSTKHENGTIEQKIGDLYKLLMDSVRLNKDGVSVISQDLEAIDAIKSVDEVFPFMTKASLYGKGGIIGAFIGADEKNSKMNIVEIGAGGLTLRTKDYYLSEDSAMQNIRKMYVEHMTKMFTLAGDEQKKAEERAANVMALETRMAKKTRSMVEMRDPEKNYNKMSYDEFKARFKGVDWDEFFSTNLMEGVKEVNVGQPETLEEAIKIVTSAPLDQLKDYMRWDLICSASGAMGDQMENEHFDFFSRKLAGKKVAPARWKRAVNGVNGILGMAVGQMFVKKYFPEENKKRMIELVDNLKKALAIRIDAQEWMSDSTKMRAKEKLATFRVKVGYPDKWKSYDGLVIDPSKSLAENQAAISYWMHKDMVDRKFNKPVDPEEWGMTPQTVNAYYNPTTNEICFPAGILQVPFFDMKADDAYNYGGIGATIGHEMTHGFDDEGRLFDKDGNLKSWWTEADGQEFEKRANVLSDYFDNIEVLPGLKAKGKQTLGENLADHGGLEVAWVAYKEATKDNPLPVKDGFTADQRFFISYAYTWAESIRDEQLRLQTENDVHAQAYWRVNGCLPHINAWYEAFNIGPDSKMYIPKEKRVAIW